MLELVVGSLFEVPPKKVRRIVFTVGQEEFYYLTANVENIFNRKLDHERYSVSFHVVGKAGDPIAITYENLLHVGTQYRAKQDFELRGRLHIDRFNDGKKPSRIVARLG